jgi:hypothetical protein
MRLRSRRRDHGGGGVPLCLNLRVQHIAVTEALRLEESAVATCAIWRAVVVRVPVPCQYALAPCAIVGQGAAGETRLMP